MRIDATLTVDLLISILGTGLGISSEWQK